jgi:hypothetical protein
MKTTFATMLCSLAVLSSAALLAHPGHGDDLPRPLITETNLRARVTSELEQLVAAHKIDDSWKGRPLKRLERVTRNGSAQWLAMFENVKAKKDRELFLFANVYGDIMDGGFAMDEAAAKTRARPEIERLVAVKKVSPSWQALSPTRLEKRDVGQSWEWVVVYDNPAEATNKRLFIFLTPWGDFVAAIFTGK